MLKTICLLLAALPAIAQSSTPAFTWQSNGVSLKAYDVNLPPFTQMYGVVSGIEICAADPGANVGTLLLTLIYRPDGAADDLYVTLWMPPFSHVGDQSCFETVFTIPTAAMRAAIVAPAPVVMMRSQ